VTITKKQKVYAVVLRSQIDNSSMYLGLQITDTLEDAIAKAQNEADKRFIIRDMANNDIRPGDVFKVLLYDSLVLAPGVVPQATSSRHTTAPLKQIKFIEPKKSKNERKKQVIYTLRYIKDKVLTTKKDKEYMDGVIEKCSKKLKIKCG